MPPATRVIVKRANTAERVAAALRSAITHGELRAGEHVRQEVWAQRLKVSRAPTREAMKMLVSERLLTYDTHRGYFVAALDPQEMAQVYLIRQLLETEILRTIRWPNDDELAHLHKIADETIALLQAEDVHGALDSARELSFAIFDLSPLELIATEVKRHWGMADLYRSLSMGESRAADPSANGLRAHHRELFAALESRDRRRLIKHNTAWRASMVDRWGRRLAGQAATEMHKAKRPKPAPGRQTAQIRRPSITN